MSFYKQLQLLGFKTYSDYLDSPYWTNFKRRYRGSGRLVICSVCGASDVQLHHWTYERLGKENLDDVVPVCRQHHDLIHAWLLNRKKKVEDTVEAIEFLKSGGTVSLDELIEKRNTLKPAKKENKPKDRTAAVIKREKKAQRKLSHKLGKLKPKVKKDRAAQKVKQRAKRDKKLLKHRPHSIRDTSVPMSDISTLTQAELQLRKIVLGIR